MPGMDVTALGKPAQPIAQGHSAQNDKGQNDKALRAVARELEASFLAEMLKSAGLGKSRESFGGGEGENQFASFLVQEHAKALVDAGGIGLSEAIFEALKEKNNADT